MRKHFSRRSRAIHSNFDKIDFFLASGSRVTRLNSNAAIVSPDESVGEKWNPSPILIPFRNLKFLFFAREENAMSNIEQV
jgi:hypothetical protein